MMHKTKIISLTVFLAFLNSCSLSSKTSVGHRKSQPKRLAVDKILKIPSRDAVDFSNLKSQQPFKKNVNSKKQRSLAQEERGETTNYQLATSNSLVAMLPTQSLKRGVREYLQMIGLESYEYDDFGGQNSGLIAYNQNLMSKNSCFAKLVSYFYFNINKKNTEHLVNYPPTPTYLFENLAVSTKNLNIPSGWVWNYAQDITRNDPNLSMSLLGICGHDNTAQLGDGEEVCVEVSDSVSCWNILVHLSSFRY